MKSPLSIFDTLEQVGSTKNITINNQYSNNNDIRKAYTFLQSYTGSIGTFNAYRREIERFLQWCLLVANKTLNELKREDIEAFIRFCQNPPKHWIGLKKSPRFIIIDEERIANPEWRPFVVTVSKPAFNKGKRPNIKDFEFSPSATKDLFAILSSFYNYLLQDEYVNINPVAIIRQKSKFVRKSLEKPKIRRLSELQWSYVLEVANEMANEKPELHERTLFMISAFYSMYLRISELSANKRWTPLMRHFFRDHDNNWWFITVGKGNKQRQIAVSDSMLAALKRWRKYLGLSQLPTPADVSPLLPKHKGKGPMNCTRTIRGIVQICFDKARQKLKSDNLPEEAESLAEATVHWLRHTGISDDVKHRPREHVRDDAGHGSSAVTDKYIDIELRERHRSAKSKPIDALGS